MRGLNCSHEPSGLGCGTLSHQPNSVDKKMPVKFLRENGILGFETQSRSRWGRLDTELGSFCLYFNPFCYLLSDIKPDPNNSPPCEQAHCALCAQAQNSFLIKRQLSRWQFHQNRPFDSPEIALYTSTDQHTPNQNKQLNIHSPDPRDSCSQQQRRTESQRYNNYFRIRTEAAAKKPEGRHLLLCNHLWCTGGQRAPRIPKQFIAT